MRGAAVTCWAVIGFLLGGSSLAAAATVSERIIEPDDPGGDRGFEATLRYTAGRAEANRLRVEQAPSGDAVMFTDRGVRRVDIATSSCPRLDTQRVLCRLGQFVEHREIDLRGKRDTALLLSADFWPGAGGHVPVRLRGGAGADVLWSETPLVDIYGGGGNDRITVANGGGANYPVACGPGRDGVFLDGRKYRVLRDCELVERPSGGR